VPRPIGSERRDYRGSPHAVRPCPLNQATIHDMLYKVMQMPGAERDSGKTQLKAITVRLDREDYRLLQSHADARNVSLNVVVNEAVADYGRRIAREAVLQRIAAFRESLPAPGTGQPDAVEIIKELRRERAEHLAGRPAHETGTEPPDPGPRGGGAGT